MGSAARKAIRRLGWELTCLGFAGECHLDPVAARAIARTPAGLISLCLGGNVHGFASMSARTFPGQVSRFIQTIRDAHPSVPIAVLTPITSPPRERLPNQVGLTRDEVRTAVADAVRTLRSCGETRLHLIDSPGVLGPGDAHLLLDDALHPDADGYRLMADRLTPRLATIAAH